MKSRETEFRPLRLSIDDLIGRERAEAVCAARAFLAGEDREELRRLAAEAVDLYPCEFHEKLLSLLPRVGTPCTASATGGARGAPSHEFETHTKTALAPLSALGWYRLGEDGRLYLIAKSEHYHVALGHGFPGYRLVEVARRLGIPNATHNNTRGHVTRLLEEDLVRAAAGIRRGDRPALDRLLGSTAPADLNRVINLETGSIAAEAALKMVLSRFTSPQPGSPAPRYAGRIPVLLVIGDDRGRLLANYHGTTILAQALRGMWSDLAEGLERHGLLAVKAVPPDDLGALDEAFARWDAPPFKVAAFIYELVLMNYGARVLGAPFVRRVHELCEARDVPTLADEIQTGIWSPRIYLFREFAVRPSFVVIGKGFPGGEFAASRVLFSAAMDTLPQFGALVTNGQEELAALAYLIAIRWAEENAEVTSAVGEHFQARLREVASRHRGILATQGKRHLAGIQFHDLETGRSFVEALERSGVDANLQAHNDASPPTVILKLPLIVGFEVVDLLIERTEAALGGA